MLRSVNPATGQETARYEEHSDAEVRRRLGEAERAFAEWSRRMPEERSAILLVAAARLRRETPRHAALIVEEMGKPVRQARAEVEKCASALEYYGRAAPAWLEPREVVPDSEVGLEPLGPLLGVMPWNFPYWQVVRFAAPALAAGNVVLVKHASNVTGCLRALEATFREAGLAREFQGLEVGSGRVAAVVADPRIRGVSLTGSDAAGVAVGGAAGEAVKPAVLELGGSDPFLVLADADVGTAAREAARARCINSGQSCIAAKRFLVHKDVYDAFRSAFVDAMARQRVGDPRDESTDVGPLARPDVRQTLVDQVARSIALGARPALAGGAQAGPGFFFTPAVLEAVPAHAPAWREEVFGPVAPLAPFSDEDEAVRRANETPYGLGASVWTRDEACARSLARRLEAGMVFVNQPVQSDPALPFGGVKRSGFGRELGPEGLRAFVNVKTIRRRAA